jgi:outer membrane lipoprotein-sorting protein
MRILIAVVLAASLMPSRLSAQDTVVGIAAHFTDARFEVASHIVNDSGQHDNVLRISFRKPHFARCEVLDGNGAGGVAVWRGGPKVLVRPPGLLSRFALALDRNDPHVVDSRGRGCGQTTLDNFATEFAAHGKIEESAGPAIDGTSTESIAWQRTSDDPSGDTKRFLYLSTRTHLPVELKSYHGDVLVEDSHFRNIKLDTGMPFSTFEL